MLAEQLDIAVHPPFRHPLDPYADGLLVTRREGERVEIVVADQHILLDCGFLWDIVANAEVFKPWCQLIPPATFLYKEGSKLDLEANFDIAPGMLILGLDVPTNRPTLQNPYPICQHWTMRLTVGSRLIAYTIGSFRPSIVAMEASWSD